MTGTDQQGRMESFQAIEKIVTALRALSAMRLVRATAALEAVRHYELVYRRALATLDTPVLDARPSERILTLAFGSDQGLCGNLNRRIADRAANRISAGFIAIGVRVAELLDVDEVHVSRRSAESVAGTDTLIADLAEDMEQAVRSGRVDTIEAIHPVHVEAGRFRIGVTRVFPFDRARLGVPEAPMAAHHHEAPAQIARHLVLEWMHTVLYWVALETLASIHGARLETCDAAARTIDRRIDELRKERSRLRQTEITNEVQGVLRSADVLAAARRQS